MGLRIEENTHANFGNSIDNNQIDKVFKDMKETILKRKKEIKSARFERIQQNNKFTLSVSTASIFEQQSGIYYFIIDTLHYKTNKNQITY